MRDDCVTLRLASIQHEARAFFAGSHVQHTAAFALTAIEPSDDGDYDGPAYPDLHTRLTADGHGISVDCLKPWCWSIADPSVMASKP